MPRNARTAADRADDFGLPPASAAAASPFADIHTVIALGAPLGRDYLLRLVADDPRFPAPVIGGKGAGSRRIWSRKRVVEYFAVLAEEGEYVATATS